MSRLWAGVGGGLGTVIGAIVGEQIVTRFPVRLKRNDGIALGAGAGAVIGAALGAGPDAQTAPASTGVHGLPSPRFP